MESFVRTVDNSFLRDLDGNPEQKAPQMERGRREGKN